MQAFLRLPTMILMVKHVSKLQKWLELLYVSTLRCMIWKSSKERHMRVKS